MSEQTMEKTLIVSAEVVAAEMCERLQAHPNGRSLFMGTPKVAVMTNRQPA
jgi:hypothetical protein